MWLAVLGPGRMVMLADTDAGSVITAAQSGSEWGYSLILPEFILIPILYGVQEVTIRLGLHRQGHGALIRDKFRRWVGHGIGRDPVRGLSGGHRDRILRHSWRAICMACRAC